METEGLERGTREQEYHQLTKKQKRYLPVKRMLDVLIAGTACIVLSPIMAAVCVAIKLDSPGPILFRQQRVGKDKALFEIYKFRTMRVDAPKDRPTHLLSDPEQYITRVGRFLRKTSLDELPQLFNILRGDMYIVSSRPALWNQTDLISARDRYGVHQIAPGLTGWAQIHGRDELPIDVKAKYDGDYMKALGFKIDLMCFFGTIVSVLRSDGVVEGGTGAQEKDKSFGDYGERKQ